MDQLTAHLDRGWDLVGRGELGGAKISAQKCLELDAESPEAHNLMAYVYAAEGDADAALLHYRQALELDETFFEAMLNAADLLIHPLGQHEEALRLTDEALDYAETEEEVVDATLLKIEALVHGGARAEAERLVRGLPAGPFALPHLELLVGRAHFELGDKARAEAHLTRAIERDPDAADAHYHLGLLHEERGDRHAATVAFLRAREADLRVERPTHRLDVAEFEQVARDAIAGLAAEAQTPLEGALVVVCDAPGAEVVADGVDPRLPVLLDDLRSESGALRVGRVFLYQRNFERTTLDRAALEEELARAIEHELRFALDQHRAASTPGDGVAAPPGGATGAALTVRAPDEGTAH